MKKNINKKILTVLMIVLVVIVVTTTVYAAAPAAIGVNQNFPTFSGVGSVGKIDTAAKKVWGTVTLVAQIAAFAAIVFAGIKYMFASADEKADLKKGLSILVVGAVLVFATATVVQFITGAADEII